MAGFKYVHRKKFLYSHPAHAGTPVAGLVTLASKESFHYHPKSMDKLQGSHKQHPQALLNTCWLKNSGQQGNGSKLGLIF